jgi:CBS domain-containing protein
MFAREILAVKGEGGGIFSTSPDNPVPAAIEMMVQHNIGSLVVLNAAGLMVGIITERDILRATHKHSCDLSKLKVSDLMTTNLIVAGPEDTVNYVRGIMTENRIRHLPVVDGEKVLGLITFHDVAKATYKEITFENELLKKYIKHWPE